MDVFRRLISRLSRTRRFCWSEAFFFPERVVRISGSFQFIVPVVQWRECFEIPEMVSSDFEEVVSAWCCPIRVWKETLV